MRTSTTCAVLVSLAEAAAAFAPSLSTLPRAGIAATCTVRAIPTVSRPVRVAPLRLGGLQMAATTVPITVTGTNIEVFYPSLPAADLAEFARLALECRGGNAHDRWWCPDLRSACSRREGVCRLRDNLVSVLWFGRP